jgi:hypothetical protein
MAIFDFLHGEFIDVVHWVEGTRDIVFGAFERQRGT